MKPRGIVVYFTAQLLINVLLINSWPAALFSAQLRDSETLAAVPVPFKPLASSPPESVPGEKPFKLIAGFQAEAPQAVRVPEARLELHPSAALSSSVSVPENRPLKKGVDILRLNAQDLATSAQRSRSENRKALAVQSVQPPEGPRAIVAHAPDEYTTAASLAEERALPASPHLAVRPSTLRFAMTDAGALPASQNLEVTSDRREGVRFEIANLPDWLTTETRRGRAGLTAAVARVSVNGRKIAGPLKGVLEVRNLDAPSEVLQVAVEVERSDRTHPLRSYDANGRLQRLVRPDGGILDYDYDDQGQLIRIRYPDGTAVTWTYDNQGRRTSRTDVQGTTVYRYDEQGRLDTVYNPSFEPLRYGYDAKGFLTTLTLPRGRVVAYGYNEAGQLLSVRGDLGTTSYAYDPVTARLAERTLPNGLVTSYGYDVSGRLAEVTHRDVAGKLQLGFSWQLDDQGRPVSETRETAAGLETTSFSYGAGGQIASVTFPDDRAVTYEYDASGRRSRVTETRNGTVAVSDYTYDDLGRLIRAGDETFTYDVNGDLVRRTTPGRTLDYSWDFEGRLNGFRDDRHRVSWLYDGDGRRISEEVDGRRTYLLQDESGWIGQVLLEVEGDSPKGAKSLRSHLYGLEALGVEGEEGAGSFYLYENPLHGSVALATPGGELAETFTSDPFGALLSRPAGALPPFLFAGAPYDPVTGLIHLDGRDYDPSLGAFLHSSLDQDAAAPSGAPGSWADHAATGAFSQALVRAFRPVSPSGPDRRDKPTAGRTSGQDPPASGDKKQLQFTILQSNALAPAPPAQKRSRALPSPYQESPGEGAVYHRGDLLQQKAATTARLKLQPEYLPFAKTAAGLLPASQTLQVTSTDGQALSFTLASSIPWLSVSGGAGTTPASFTVTANPAGLTEAGSPYVGDITLTNTADSTDVRKVRVRLTVRSTGAAVTLRSFDSNGNLRRVIKPDGGIVDLQVDALGRITQVIYPAQPAVSYAYDGNGNRISMTDQRGTTYYQYDRQNRLTGTFTPLDTNFIPVFYGYDNAGHLTSLATPDGRTLLYAYNADGQMARVTDGANVTTYTYDATSGRLASQTLPNGITTTYTYDTDGRLTDVVHKSSSGALIMGFHYVLNTVGQKISVTKQTPSGSELTSYTYNARGFLKSVTYPDGKQVTYTYDAFGNRLSTTTVQGTSTTVVNYVYDKGNRLLKAGNEVFTYDGNGNLIRRSSPERTVNYSFDARNLLTRVDDGSNPVTFEYDGDGNRIAKDANGQRINYINDTRGPITQVLVEADAAWQVQHSYSYGEQRISRWSPSSSQFYLRDASSVAAVTDAATNLSEVYSYDAFGLPTGSAGGNQFLFDGEAFDPESGLIYLRARYYDPLLGRFLSRDPFAGKRYKPDTINPYVFVGNEPVNKFDPSGLCPQCIIVIEIGEVIVESIEVYEIEAAIAPEAVSLGDIILSRAAEHASKIGDFTRAAYDEANIFILENWGRAQIGLGIATAAAETPAPLGISHAGELAHSLTEIGKELWGERNEIGEAGQQLWEKTTDFFDGLFPLSDSDIGDFEPNYDPGIFEPGIYGGNFAWDLGGVDLNKTADLLLSVQDVTGATFDAATGQIVILGKNDVTLPPLDMSHVAVAVQSEYGGQDPGVSIDLPIVNNQMPVRYEGQTRNTRFGDILFQADRTLKILTLGKDNVTGQTVTSSVPGYKNMLQRRLAAGCNSMPTSTRMWFQPKEVRLVPSTDGKSMVFDTVSMELLYESKVGNRVVSDPVAAAFAAHFTQNYEAFAAEWPILKKLEQLGKIVGIIKWIKDNHIPIDLSFLAAFPIQAFTTNIATPAVTVQGTTQNGPLICTVTLQGGVTYITPNQYLAADPAAGAALTEALANRPSEGTFKWTYQPSAGTASLLKATTPVTAVSESLTRSRRDGNTRFREADLSSPLPGGGRLALVRTYSSFLDRTGPLGPGWSVLPAELRFPVDRETFTFGSANLSLSLYARIWVTEWNAGREDAYDLLGIDSSNLPIYQRADTPNILRQQSDGTFLLTRVDSSKAVFRADGKPLSLTDRNGNTVTLTYDPQTTDRLLHLDAAGQTITLTYNAQGRLTQAAGPGSRQVGYGYDAQGHLTNFTDYAARARTYGYDTVGNLISATDATGQTIFSSSYDDYNRTPSRKLGAAAHYDLSFDLTAGKTTVTDPFGRTAQRTFERRQLASPSGLPNEVVRPTQSGDPLGNHVTTTWANDAFGPRTVTDAQGASTQLAWDNRGHLTTVQDPLGKQSQRYYDWRDRVVAVRDPEGLATGYGYDDKNNLTTVYHDVVLTLDGSGNLTSFNYDPANVSTLGYDSAGNLTTAANPLGRQAQVIRNTSGQPTRVTTPASVVTNLTYDTRSRLASTKTGSQQVTYGYDTADQVVSVATTAGTTSLTRDAKGRVTRATDALGQATSYAYNADGNLTSVTDPASNVTTYTYDALGHLLSASLPNGTSNAWEYDELGRPVAALTGLGAVAPALALSAQALGFGTVAVGNSRQLTLTLLNQGTAALTVSGITVSAPFSVAFSGPVTIPPGSALPVVVTFTPTDGVTASANLSITSNDPATPIQLVALTGDGARKVVNLRATPQSDGILLTWDAFSPGSQSFGHFDVYRSTTPIPGDVTGLAPFDQSLTSASATSFQDTLATPGTSYYYAVTPVYANGAENKNVDPTGPAAFFTTFGPLTPDAGLATATQSENRPAIGYNSTTNEYLVVYERSVSASNTDIYGQRVSAAGTPIGSPIVLANSTHNERHPRLAYNSNSNNFLVIWEYDETANGSDYDLQERTVSATGALGTLNTIGSTAIQDLAPEISFCTASHEYLAVYQTDGNGDGKTDLGVLRLNATGALLDAASYSIQSNSVNVHATNPHMAYNSTLNDFMLVFEADVANNGSNIQVWETRIKPDFTFVDGQIYIVALDAVRNTNPFLAYGSAQNQYLLTWEADAIGNGANVDVYFRRISATGAEGSNPFSLASQTVSERNPRAVYNRNLDDYVVAWEAGGTNPTITERRVHMTPSTIFIQFPTDVSSGTASRVRPDIGTSLQNNTFLAVWEQDAGSGNFDIRSRVLGTLTPTLQASPTSLSFSGATVHQTLTITNGNPTGGLLQWTATPNQPWLTTQPGSGSTTSSMAVDVAVNRTGLAPGTYPATIHVASNNGSTDVPVTLTIGNLPPATPSSPNPVDGAVDQATVSGGFGLALSWQGSDPDGDALTWDVYFDTDVAKVTALDPTVRRSHAQTATTFQPSGMTFATTYAWRVVAFDTHGGSTAGPVWRFTTTAISAPVLVPVTPDPTRNARPTLAWQAVTGAASYHLQVAANSGFTTPLVDATGLAAVSYTPGTALPEGTIWWRVRTFDAAGKPGAFSTASSFVVDLTAPAVPVLVPVTPNPTNNRQPSLAWSAVAGASGYRVQVASTSSFTAPLEDATVSTLSYQPTADLPEGQIYWRAASLDEAGNQSAFSSAGSFIVDATPPPAITGLTAHRNGTGVDLAWSPLASPPADFARFRIYRSLSAFANTTGVPLLDQSLTSPSAVSFRDTTVAPATAYWYSVTTVDTTGNENLAALVASVPANEPPTIPVLIAPAVGIQVTPTSGVSVALSWQSSDPEQDPLRYDIYLSTDSSQIQGTPDLGSRIAASLTLPGFTAPGLLYRATYYWRVAAVDLAGDGSPSSTTFGPVWSFSIGAIPAPILTALTPDPSRDLRPTFHWQSVIGAVGYRIEIASDPTFSSSLVSSDVTATSFTPASDLPEGSLHWRVLALDAQGLPGDFSAVDDFVVDATAPAIPVLVPVTPDPTNNRRPNLAWGVVAGASGYRVQVSTDAGFAAPLVDATLGTSPYIPASDLPEGRIYWRVASQDGAGNQSAFASADDFLVDATAPGVPVLVPVTPDPTNNRRPSLAWGAVAGTSGYRVQVSTDAGFAAPLIDAMLSTSPYAPASDLPEGRIYWRVASQDGAGNQSAFSAADDFLVDVTAPGVPVLVPVAPDPTNNRRPNLTWGAVAGASVYRVQVSTDAGFTVPLIDATLSTSPYASASDLPEGRIYWRVASQDGAGNQSAFASADDFLVDATAPGVPVLVPVAPDPTNNRRPSLAWGAVAGASGYRVQVSTDAGFTVSLIDATLSTSPYAPASDLPEGRIYWRVASQDGAGNQSAFSAADDFLVDATAPEVPVLVPVTPDPTNNRRPSLSWGGVAGASGYRVQVSTDAGFTAPLIDTAPGTFPYVPAVDLPEGRIYWRVASRDEAGNQSVLSAADDFLLDITPPAVPVLTPVLPNPTSVARPSLGWIAVQDAASYRLQVARDPGFAAPLIDITISGTVFVPTSDLPEGPVYWRVSSLDSLGNASAFSSASSFVADRTPPPAVAGFFVAWANLGFRLFWDATPAGVTDIAVFRVYRSAASFTDVTGLTPIATIANPQVTTFDDSSASPQTVYYYAVTAVDSAGNELRLVTSVVTPPPTIFQDSFEAGDTSHWQAWPPPNGSSPP
ncbi:MAG TPA: RHS repeat-associated core domain-containing protein [Thermoanaerobaculia bacterium]|nr:RHS repeat-associated core domain-containing protein [Thermoanaerobaculia bacterium]